jgi:MATE family multidrug resistance protein
LAAELLARDLAECSDDDEVGDDSAESDTGDLPALYRRPSAIADGTARPALGVKSLHEPALTSIERARSRDAERSLLRDNHIIPPKHPVIAKPSLFSRIYKRLFSTKVPLPSSDEEIARQPTETSALLGPEGNDDEHLNEQWEAAVADGRIKTTWQREAKTIAVYSRSLIVTFLLQYSINTASIFTVARIGKIELGAVSCKLPCLSSCSSSRIADL